MILLLDIGNSFIKWAWLEPDWLKQKQQGLPVLTGADELLHVGEQLPLALDEAWSDFPVPVHVWISNVAGEALQGSLHAWLTQHWNCPVDVAQSESKSLGVTNSYPDPSQMGVDRWLVLLAAKVSGAGPRAVIDCGTAITVDAMNAEGQHLGGLILPGLKMMRDSIYSDTDGVAKTDESKTVPGMLFANNTSTAVDVGCHYAIVAFIERVIADMDKEISADLTCLLTGGDAEEVLPLLSVKVEHQELLVLQGLAVYAGKNGNT